METCTIGGVGAGGGARVGVGGELKAGVVGGGGETWLFPATPPLLCFPRFSPSSSPFFFLLSNISLLSVAIVASLSCRSFTCFVHHE